MDHLAALFAHATPSARTFFTGSLCTTTSFSGGGHLHLLRSGSLVLGEAGVPDRRLAEPCLLFYPRDRPHRFHIQADDSADLACATVDLGAGIGNPIGLGLPDFVLLPLASHPSLQPACDLLLAEAFAEDEGRQAALDRLFDYLLVLIIRHVIAAGTVQRGVLAGLAEPRLARALTAMHEAPRQAWTLEDLAAVAGMSRTRFAELFRAVIGRTAMDYLTVWRMTAARGLLAKGRPVKSVAGLVGYANVAAFSRVFARVTGHPPRSVAGPS